MQLSWRPESKNLNPFFGIFTPTIFVVAAKLKPSACLGLNWMKMYEAILCFLLLKMLCGHPEMFSGRRRFTWWLNFHSLGEHIHVVTVKILPIHITFTSMWNIWLNSHSFDISSFIFVDYFFHSRHNNSCFQRHGFKIFSRRAADGLNRNTCAESLPAFLSHVEKPPVTCPT